MNDIFYGILQLLTVFYNVMYKIGFYSKNPNPGIVL